MTTRRGIEQAPRVDPPGRRDGPIVGDVFDPDAPTPGRPPIPVDGWAMLRPQDCLIIYVRSDQYTMRDASTLQASIAAQFPPEFRDRVIVVTGPEGLAIMRGES